MPIPDSPEFQIDRALHAGHATIALRIADSLIAQSKRSHIGWLGRARATYAMGMHGECEEATAVVLKLRPDDPPALLLRGLIYRYYGLVDDSVATLSKLVAMKTPYSPEAALSLAETLFFAHRRKELLAHIAAGGSWLDDERGALLRARVKSWTDVAVATQELRAISESASGPNALMLTRVAGFEAVKLLDQAGHYREAFDLAQRLHARTTPPFDIEGLVSGVRARADLARKRGRWFEAKVPPVEGVAMIAGLPRAGTTLIEQMLDAHPEVSGIGEFDGVRRLASGITATGIDFAALGSIDRERAMALQREYLGGAHRLRREGARWSFDKTLGAWKALPEIAAILPGAKLLHVARDPRDNAISAHLSFFHPVSYGWMSSLDSIRRGIEAERAALPQSLEALKIDHVALVYERLVEDPAGHAKACLDLLGLPMDARVLKPEENTRAVFTLSHDQVKRPINRGSIGRWKNYEWAFDSSWDALCAAHDTRRSTGLP